MEILNDKKLDEFREEARTWLAENIPDGQRPPDDAGAREFDCHWQATQFAGGWGGVSWPKEYGGRGLSAAEQLIWYEEMARAKAPSTGAFTVALGHAGPTIIAVGTEEQKATYLEPIISGKTPWCQGFSEPGSGSDLASLRTRAVIDGDELVVNGQKIWTSFAMLADYQELLCRTDPDVPKHRGISWVILDMKTPGLTVRPIKTINGMAHFAECFYDNVRIPLKNVVGGIDNGWSTAMTTLSHERGLGYLASRLLILEQAEELIREADKRNVLEGRLAYELACMRAEAQVVHALGYDGIADGRRRELVAGVNQLFNGELSKRLERLALDVLNSEGLERGSWTTGYLSSFPATIAGGTKDIQKNILGERVLGLPR
jgi:alkylation response protein AidB-like acyl-CoA dehydrogenase